MIWNFLAPIVGGVVGLAGAGSANAAQSDQYAQQVREAEIAHKDAVYNLRASFQDQQLAREWNYQTGLGEFQLQEQARRNEFQQNKFQTALNELRNFGEDSATRYQYERSRIKQAEDAAVAAHDFEVGEIRAELDNAQRIAQWGIQEAKSRSQIEEENFNRNFTLLQEQQQVKLARLGEDTRIEMQDMRNDSIRVMAESSLDIAIGALNANIHAKRMEAMKNLDSQELNQLNEAGALLALGTTSGTAARLMGDIARQRIMGDRAVNGELATAVAAMKNGVAEAKTNYAAQILEQRFSSKKVYSDPVLLPQRAPLPKVRVPRHVAGISPVEFIPAPEMPEYRIGTDEREFIPGVAPVRGPEPVEPLLPEEPLVFRNYSSASQALHTVGGAIQGAQLGLSLYNTISSFF